MKVSFVFNQLVLELCRSEQPVDIQTIQPHLDRIKAPISTAKDHHVSKTAPGKTRVFNVNNACGVSERVSSAWIWALSFFDPAVARSRSTRWRSRRWTSWSWCTRYWRIRLKENISSRWDDTFLRLPPSSEDYPESSFTHLNHPSKWHLKLYNEDYYIKPRGGIHPTLSFIRELCLSESFPRFSSAGDLSCVLWIKVWCSTWDAGVGVYLQTGEAASSSRLHTGATFLL